MHLNMYINDQLIESFEITASNIHKLKIIQADLESRHSDILDLSKFEPVFFLDGLPSRINDINKEEKKIIYN
jgi:hypothetical protein